MGPLAAIAGKETLLEAAKRLQSFLNGVTIRTVFADQNQAMIVFDLIAVRQWVFAQRRL